MERVAHVMASGKKVQPWERRINESAEAFDAFAIYRDLGVGRNLIKVWQQLGKSHTLIERWSRRHDWVFRCVEFDRFLDSERLKALVRGTVAMRERQAKIAARISQRIGDRVERMTDEEVDTLSPQEIATLFLVSTDVETKARAANVLEEVETPFEVHIHTYAPGQEPEPMRNLAKLGSL
jgi:hypothetical protein